MMNGKTLFLFLLMFFSLGINAQTTHTRSDDDIQLQIDQLMKAREEMFKSMLDDSGFENFDKRFEDLIKNFEKAEFAPGVGMGGAVIGEYDWRETDTQQIFALKVKQIKDRPLDIKIEKGMIKLKGDVESTDEDLAHKTKRVSKVHFERSFSIPDGVDQTNPQFENKDGELLIKFKKIAALKKAPGKTFKNKSPADLEPITPDSGDVII